MSSQCISKCEFQVAMHPASILCSHRIYDLVTQIYLKSANYQDVWFWVRDVQLLQLQ
jgi:hypothetical protein